MHCDGSGTFPAMTRLGMLLISALALSALACESAPVRTWRGARLYEEGTQAFERGESRRAVTELEEAARLVPQASEIQNHLGLAYWAEGRMDEAGNAFEAALELDCDNFAARENLRRLELVLDQREQANPDGDATRRTEDEEGTRGG